MSQEVEFSVVIPTLDRPQKLHRALLSIMAMESVSVEVIVVDQSQNAETRGLVQALNHKSLRYEHLDTRGRGRALCHGARLAHGKYVAITDDDVVVASDWLSRAREVFETHHPCDAVVGRIRPFGDKPGEGYLDPQTAEWPEALALSPRGLWKGFGANQVFLKAAWEAVGGMDPRLGTGNLCGSSDDWDILYRMLVSGMVVRYSPAVVIWHDGWETAETREQKARIYDRSRMASHIKCWCEVGGPALRDITALTLREFSEGIRHLVHRRRGTAMACFRKFGHYASGVPLGIKLGMSNQGRKGARV